MSRFAEDSYWTYARERPTSRFRSASESLRMSGLRFWFSEADEVKVAATVEGNDKIKNNSQCHGR